MASRFPLGRQYSTVLAALAGRLRGGTVPAGKPAPAAASIPITMANATTPASGTVPSPLAPAYRLLRQPRWLPPARRLPPRVRHRPRLVAGHPVPAGLQTAQQPTVDENEDGGRAIAIEEGISAQIFSHAAAHDYFRGYDQLDPDLLDQLTAQVGHLEVGIRRPADWQRAILSAYAAWNQLRDHGHRGVVHADLLTRTMTFQPASEQVNIDTSATMAQTG